MFLFDLESVPCFPNLGCELIEVRASGSVAKDQHNKMGIYKKEKYLHNGKSVFKHQDKDEFLFKLSSKIWLVILIMYLL